MDKIAAYRTYVKQVLQKYGSYLPSTNDVETQYLFDDERNHYQLWQVGWEKSRWIHGCLLHFDIKNNKIWIQHNGTDVDIAEDFLNVGVPKEDIVLGFQAPYKRKYTGFAEQ